MRINLTKFVIVNKDTFNFLNGGGESEERLEFAEKFSTIDGAIKEVNKCDYPEDFEIRELEISLKLGKVCSETFSKIPPPKPILEGIRQLQK